MPSGRGSGQHHAEGTEHAIAAAITKVIASGRVGCETSVIAATLPPKRREILFLSTVRMEMFPVASSSRLPLWPPSGRGPVTELTGPLHVPSYSTAPDGDVALIQPEV